MSVVNSAFSPVRLLLSPSSIRPGDEITVSLPVTPRPAGAVTLGVQVFCVGPVTTSWALSTSLAITDDGTTISAVLDKTGDLVPGRLYELRSIELRSPSEDEAPMLTFIGGRDYGRAFFEVMRQDDQPRSIDEIRLAAYSLEEEQRIRMSQPLGAAASLPNVRDFRALSLAQRCLLTRRIQLPGFEMFPLAVGNPSLDEAELVNRLLWELKWKARIDAQSWTQMSSRENPIVVFHFPRVRAVDHGEAAEIAGRRRDEMLDLLSLHRGSHGHAFVLVVEDCSNGEFQVYSELPTYGGNVLGGFISGEDTETLIIDSQSISTDSLLALFVSLFRDAQAERQVDFAFFRYWNLLEAVAVARVPDKRPVTDFSGAHLRDGTADATTSRARGRVYELLKDMMSVDLAESSFVQEPAKDLWDTAGIWYAFRNAAAHYGGFRPGDPKQRAKPWYKAALGAYQHLESRGTARRVGSDPYLTSLKFAAQFVVHWQLRLQEHR